jgi:hypothetical protein
MMSAQTVRSGVSDDRVAEPFPEYISPAQIARRLPPNKGSKPVHAATIIRWITHGVRAADGSRIALRAVRLPGGWKSTWEWVEDFIERLTADRTPDSVTAAPAPLPSAGRQKALERVDRELDRLGV